MADTPETTAAARRPPRRSRATEALSNARDRTYSAYETARARTSDVTRQVSDQMAVYPAGAVIGGLAIGALVGFLLPRSQRETELFGDTGRKLADAARDAAKKGVEAGRARADQVTGSIVNRVGGAIVDAVGGKDGD